MTIEAVQVISDLNENYPRANDLIKEGDDHIRMIKNALKRTFPNVKGTTSISHDKLNALDSGTALNGSGFQIFRPTIFTSDLSVNGTTRVGQLYTGGIWGNSLELTAATPVIDFHFGNSGADYTTRIIATKAADTLQVTSPNNNIYFEVDGRLHVTREATIGGALNSGGDLSSQGNVIANNTLRSNNGVVTAGGIHGPWIQTNVAPPYAGASSQGAYMGWNDGALSGGTMFRNHRGLGLGGFFFDLCDSGGNRINWASIDGNANFSTGGSIQSRSGNVNASGGDVIASNAVRSGSGCFAGSAVLSTDGNVNGSTWGGWLSSWLTNGSNVIRVGTPRIAGFDGWEGVGQLIQFRIDGQPWGIKCQSSDERLKENIKDVNTEDCLDKINSIPIKSFRFKDVPWKTEDGNSGVDIGRSWSAGFIAQDLEKIIPESVYQAGDKDSIRQVDTLPLTANLVAAIQVLTKRIEELEAKLEA